MNDDTNDCYAVFPDSRGGMTLWVVVAPRDPEWKSRHRIATCDNRADAELVCFALNRARRDLYRSGRAA